MRKNTYQNIVITLSDGRRIAATVPAFVKAEDHIVIMKVEVTEERELEDGLSWGTEHKEGEKII